MNTTVYMAPAGDDCVWSSSGYYDPELARERSRQLGCGGEIHEHRIDIDKLVLNLSAHLPAYRAVMAIQPWERSAT